MTTALVTRIQDLKGSYTLDTSHSRVGFVVRHAMITKVRGAFNDLVGTAEIDGADPSNSNLQVTIQAASIDTREANRDAHLTSPDFFDVATHPTITFTATNFTIVDDETVEVTGDLTIKGITHPVTIPFTFTGQATDPFGNNRAGFEGSIVISRKEWGLTWNAAIETGGVMLSDKVTLEFEVSAVKN